MAKLLLKPGFATVGIQQRITAGGTFNGTLPSTEVTRANGLNKFAPAAAGGLFDFELDEAATVQQISVDMNGNSALTVSIVNLDADRNVISGEDVRIYSGTVQLLNMSEPIILGKRQALKIACATTGQVMIARVMAVVERSFKG